MKKILIVTDAWHPQINGVVTTLSKTIDQLQRKGYGVKTITPSMFRTIPCPSYNEISLALVRRKTITKLIDKYAPHSIHISTEGPLGWITRSICNKHKIPFTSSYHTRFPEYLRLRLPIPLSLSYKVVRSFHNASAMTMVATNDLQNELSARGFTNTALWSRGVDCELFQPINKSSISATPMLVYVGRVAVEKNIEAFLQLKIPCQKVIVGDGPARKELEKKYPKVHFVGYQKGQDLAHYIAQADAFVFPSKTDTFGVVMLEAMACGVPVAAYPVSGPQQVVRHGVSGFLDDDLERAVEGALQLSPKECRREAEKYSWESCTEQFIENAVFLENEIRL